MEKPKNNFSKKIPDQLFRLFIVFAFLISAVILIRAYILPPELRDEELHKKIAVQTELSRKGRYSESRVCVECHDIIETKTKNGFHKFLACETCHGPGAEHTEDPEIAPTTIKGRESCSICHAYDPGRPTGFPQINSVAHNPMKACISCHDPHSPAPPQVPKECSACHGEIARTKAISPHVQLSCTTCHIVPNKHKVTPRAALPSKPEDRSFCGKCHSKDSANKVTLKVNIDSHGGKYLCWQCHYPHMPEAR